ncbi:50S ribosomal protein L18 [Candidatus Nomurabacteria bacterium]|nr:50S ribosomal protein L18 [Candidatus Nomurabacteria bacterium]
MSISKSEKRIKRHNRIRARVHGTASRPRLAVFRSNKYLYVQAINDDEGVTIASANSQTSKAKTSKEKASETGKSVAEALKAKKIDSVVFDRGGFLYAGSVKALADAAREAGLKF